MTYLVTKVGREEGERAMGDGRLNMIKACYMHV
jgi:hypothetical protein